MPDKKPRRTKAIAEQRVQQLLRIILDGAEPAFDLCEFVREQEQVEGSAWHLAPGDKPLSYSQIRRYGARAEKLIAASCRASRKKLLRRHLAQRRNLYAKAVSQGDVRAALAVLDSEAKLAGLFDAELNRLVEQLQKEIETLKVSKVSYGHGNPPQTVGNDASRAAGAARPGDAAAAGTPEAGSRPGDDPGGTGARPVAGGPPPRDDLDTGAFVV